MAHGGRAGVRSVITAMPSPDDTISAPALSTEELIERAETGRQAARALLREHPDAVVYVQAPDGQVVPPPASLGLENVPTLSTEGRSGMDLCVSEDRMELVNAWIRVRTQAVVEVRARMYSNPEQWMVAHLLDLRKTHGVIVTVLWPTDEAPEDAQARAGAAAVSTAPRFCTRKQDEEGNVIDCDEAYVQMFGYSAEELIGKPTFERVHPDDQARVIEGWVAAVASGRVQMFRVRQKRKDGSWLWVDTTLHNYLADPEQRCMLAECIDVSAEMSAQEALADREELLRNLLEEMPDGLLQLDQQRNVVYHNARLLEILQGSAELDGLGAEPSEAAEGQQPRAAGAPALPALLSALTDESAHSFDATLARALDSGVREDVELEVALAFGQQRNVLVKVRPLQRESGAVTGVIASVLDVTDSARARRELEKRASYDALTGAHNRASIMEALERELETSRDTGVVFVDLDRFKSVNDTLGHAAGDEVLVHVAERLQGAMRSSDELGRLGGDEFLILLRGVSGFGVAMSAAQRISEAVNGSCELSCGSLNLAASVGVACVDGAPISAEQLVERADAAMYRSKAQRRGIPVLAA